MESSPSRSALPNDPEAVAEVARWANGLPGHEMTYLGTWVEQMAGNYAAGWIKDALLEACSADPRQVKRYAHGCLKRWSAAGKPDLAAEERAIREARGPRPAVEPASNVFPTAAPGAEVMSRARYRRLQAEAAAKAPSRTETPA